MSVELKSSRRARLIGAVSALAVVVSGLVIASSNSVSHADHAIGDVGTVVPARLLDTRPTGETVDGEFEAAGKIAAGTFTKVQIAGRGNVPADAVGVELNITSIQNEGRGFATLYPCTATPPTASTLNYTPGVNIANATTVALNSSGEVCVFTSTTSHYALDVVAFIAAATTVSEPVLTVSGFMNCQGDFSGSYSVTGNKYPSARLSVELGIAGTGTGGRSYFDDDIDVPSSGPLRSDGPGSGEADIVSLDYEMVVSITYSLGPTVNSIVPIEEEDLDNCIVGPELVYEPFLWTDSLEPGQTFQGDEAPEALSPDGRFALVTLLSASGRHFGIADRQDQSLSVTTVDRPVGPRQDVRVIDNSGNFTVGPYGGPYTSWSAGVSSTVTNPCAGLASEIKAVPIAENNGLEVSGNRYQVCGLLGTVNAEYASAGNDYLLQIDLGPAQITRVSSIETTPISADTLTWIFEPAGSGCVKWFRMLDTGEIGKTVQCRVDSVTDTATFESRPASGPVSQSHTETVRSSQGFGSRANWTGAGTSYSFTSPAGDLTLVDIANNTRTTATPTPDCYDVPDSGNVLWNGNRVCAL